MNRITHSFSSFSVSSSLLLPLPLNRPLSTFTSRLFKLPPPPPQPPSATHHNLPTFLAHASRTALPSTATIYIGTHYEYTVQHTLRNSSFHLHRTGGRSDSGIDLLGTWHLPGHEHPLRVIVQCKALKTKLGPNLVRELEGTLRRHAPVGWRTGSQVGVLVSTRDATKGVREALARSEHPCLWMMVTHGGVLRQVLWNRRVEELGVAGGLGVEVRYSSPSASSSPSPGGDGEGSEVGKEVVLTWDGEEMEHMDSVEERMERLEERWMEVWGLNGESGRKYTRVDVLEAIEQLYPAEKPLLYGKGGPCALSGDEKAEVLQLLDSRSQPRVQAGASR
ncbi:hypothetical protein P170DRAFT_433252 [Aspergillus steynii IBT 23096]|uniref:Restriction endonuclease type IV Mrr domain-containing protein n=1 Tax=Aspergillus steynii IBT 23096 TaxID=1392250 RepID=A0A2I2GSA2_9EURO|nr:uncharacterized protein P170DRAFT_433252 [Aspergillus steynii IBT 23096]PLB55761.1 hypothetical protein P170DRAFT_433252 [Aspergillus steynii IBT 23096]